MKWTWIASVVLVLLLVAVDALREDADSSQYESANFYEIFGLDSASFKKDALRRAYHKLAKKYHPDKNPENADALKKFQRITHAFEILEDDDKRRNYDLYGEAGSQSGFDSDGSGAQAIFERFFGRGGFGFFGHGGDRRQRTPDMKVEYALSLEDIYKGSKVSIEIPRQQICSTCNGIGAKNAKDVKQCTDCNGHGIRMMQKVLAPGIIQQFQTICSRCNGNGKIYAKPCSSCSGQKVTKGTDILEFSVPAGASENYVIKMEEMADELPDHQTGDVYVIISSLPHKHFRREGNDLHTQVELTLFEALYGFTKSLKHLDGHLVELKRTQVTQPEFVAEIAGEGMPIVTESRQPTSGRGRLFIKYTVKLPSTPPLGVFKRELEKASRPVLDHDEL